ncbi:hypothetical protein O0I10_010225 [Lichtheimia ornata]|uniref:Uncharacterized protein n=1 Tax=Lichtheimia ornata TaxID=688661 RepID=A0AAD7UWJ4_9FUNG|nr:uncharacterized protein O0I10_010225 [Lichtheimia ornata]KAJ8654149.1 hypothetical protein O0I10_010225 [Lichtheimia ornata]
MDAAVIATNNNFTCPFGAVKVYPSLMAFIIKYRLEKRLSKLVTVSTSLQQGNVFWLLGGIKHRGFSYDTG